MFLGSGKTSLTNRFIYEDKEDRKNVFEGDVSNYFLDIDDLFTHKYYATVGYIFDKKNKNIDFLIIVLIYNAKWLK